MPTASPKPALRMMSAAILAGSPGTTPAASQHATTCNTQTPTALLSPTPTKACSGVSHMTPTATKPLRPTSKMKSQPPHFLTTAHGNTPLSFASDCKAATGIRTVCPMIGWKREKEQSTVMKKM